MKIIAKRCAVSICSMMIITLLFWAVVWTLEYNKPDVHALPGWFMICSFLFVEIPMWVNDGLGLSLSAVAFALFSVVIDGILWGSLIGLIWCGMRKKP